MRTRRAMILCVTLLCLFLAGCVELPPLPAGPATPTEAPTPEPTPEPTPTKPPYLSFPDGSRHDYGEVNLDLSWLCHEQVGETAALLREMPELRSVQLGMDRARSAETAGQENPEPETEEEAGPERLTWADIRMLQEAAPQAEFYYRFRFCGKDFSLQDEAMDLNHRTMDDEGAAVREILACMKHCRYLDMGFCGVSDEAMASIRDDFPEVEVVWRIWFGRDDLLSVRTDVERILASDGGFHLEEHWEPLQYCTKVKYLDLGHNPDLHDWSFLGCMPNLEVCVIAIGGWEGDDLAGLANCPHLEFLEMCSRSTKGELDLSFLAGLKELKHLDICCLFDNVVGYEALENLPQLERLWIGKYTYIPEDYIEHLRTEINVTAETGDGGAWRWVNGNRDRLQPRYALLCQQFDYGNFNKVCAWYWNDPLYYPHD